MQEKTPPIFTEKGKNEISQKLPKNLPKTEFQVIFGEVIVKALILSHSHFPKNGILKILYVKGHYPSSKKGQKSHNSIDHIK